MLCQFPFHACHHGSSVVFHHVTATIFRQYYVRSRSMPFVMGAFPQPDGPRPYTRTRIRTLSNPVKCKLWVGYVSIPT